MAAAAGAGAAAAAPPHSAALLQPLTEVDLQRHIDTRGLAAQLLPRPADLADSDVIKSLVFTANGQPVLVVIGLSGKVDERKLAKHLGVSRRKVRLASTEDALLHSGYAVGTVPPFGHRHPLRTLLDASVTRHPGPFLWAGGGHPDVELRVSVSELLSHSAPEIGDFGTGEGPPGPGVAAGDAGAAMLPLPWPPGSETVRMVGVIALRRRIAKTLLFCTLVPEATPPLPPDGQAAYVRRLWRHPGDGAPAEVQLIVGKTVERLAGREEAIALMDSTKVGCIVAVTGRVQPPPNAAAAPRTLDVVVHSLAVLHRNADARGAALRRAARDTGVTVATAEELEQLRRLGADAYSAAYLQLPGSSGGTSAGGSGTSSGDDGSDSEGAAGRGAAGARRRGGSGGGDSDPVGVSAGAPPAAITRLSSSSTSSSGEGVGSAEAPSSAAGVPEVAGVGAAGPAASPVPGPPAFWQLPYPVERVVDVVDLAGLRAMRQAIFSSVSEGSSGNSSSGSSGSSGDAGDGLPTTVVALDVEWQPFSKGEPHTPAALLQVALRDCTFLVDLPALCRPSILQPRPPTNPQAASDEQPPSSPSAAAAAGAAAARSGGTEESEAELSDLLRDVCGSPDIIKIGFFVKQDLERIQESYPWLPVFCQQAAGGGGGGGGGGGSGGGALVAAHVDLLELTRAVVPRMSSLASISLSRLAEVLLGAPLDKGQQRSDWGARPLSRRQREYAAADAAVLVALYEALLRRARDSGGGVAAVARIVRAAGGGFCALPVSPRELWDYSPGGDSGTEQ